MIIENLHPPLIRLENNPVKQYAWGWSNKQCYVGQLSGRVELNNYAQLWMGVHCNGESEIRSKIEQSSKAIKLSQFLSYNKLGSLDFLFKVLSIEKCLSIQVHPNKNQAQLLHKNQPQIYADDNDKPEMFYTLSEFQCFFGYVQHEQFQRLVSLDIFQQIFHPTPPNNPRQAIIQILRLDKQKQEKLTQFSIAKLAQIHPTRYHDGEPNRKIWRIPQDFPNDIGIVVSFFLDYKILHPGTCCYIQSNTPHAYISGECLEIMKNSDNVCRLGLTPKYKDLDVIGEVLGSNFSTVIPIQGKNQIHNGYISNSYSQKGLNLQIISHKNIPGNEDDHFIVKPSPEKRILLILAGQFKIKAANQQNYELSNKGTVLLLRADTQYNIRHIKQQGLICLGWSNF